MRGKGGAEWRSHRACEGGREGGGGRGKRHRWHPFKGEWWGAEDMGGTT
jgi:hypothetical protein